MNKYYEIRMSSFGIAICMVIFGSLLTIFPRISGIVFTRGFATIVLLYALIQLWRGLRARKQGLRGYGNLTGSGLCLILSGIGFFAPEVILSFLPFVTGSLLILDGIIKVSMLKMQWDWDREHRWIGILSAVLPLMLGIFLAAYPFHAATAVIRFFGIFLLLDGISDLVRTKVWG